MRRNEIAQTAFYQRIPAATRAGAATVSPAPIDQTLSTDPLESSRSRFPQTRWIGPNLLPHKRLAGRDSSRWETVSSRLTRR